MKCHAFALAVVVIVASFTRAAAEQIPTLCDFNSDVPGLPPQVGGQGKPDRLVGTLGNIVVQPQAFGITSQPVVISGDRVNYYSSVDFIFNPVYSGIVRVEATVSFASSSFTGHFLQTLLDFNYTDPVLTRLEMGQGAIYGYGRRVGTYSGNQPFRVREDLFLSQGTWSCQIDDELNGFWDDPVVTGLSFTNPHLTPNFHGVAAGLFFASYSPSDQGQVAYDDISVAMVPAPSTLVGLVGMGVVVALGYVWRKRRGGE